MKITEKDQIDQAREHMRGGEGSVLLHHILQSENLPGNCRLFARVTLVPGSSIGEHEHKGEAEIFYILSGHAVMTDNGKTIQMEAGDTCLTNNGSHSIRCTGSEPVEVLAAIISGVPKSS